MKYSRVYLHAHGYEMAPNVMTSAAIEERLAPLYRKLYLQPGQLEAWTGIRERRWWDPGFTNAEGARRAAAACLEDSGIPASDVQVFIYGGVSRDNFEPATACAAAEGLGLPEDCLVYDMSNACLGVMNGILAVANRIELGQIKAGMVVSCESAREITDIMIERMLEVGSMSYFKTSLATLTGGSGAAAFLLTDGSYDSARPRLLGGAARAAPQHHKICRWGMDRTVPQRWPQVMETDAIGILKHGVSLGQRTWAALLAELGWTVEGVDKVICHQIGSAHRATMLGSIGVSQEKDFPSYEFLGNMGTVALPLTACLADEREFLLRGDKVGFLGIGSGLNCLMLGWEW